MFKNVVILAGGEGTRMKPLTNYIPKGLVNVNGEPLIKGVINLFKEYDIENIYSTYGYLSNILFNEINTDIKGFINTTNKDNSYFLFNSFVKYIDEPIIVIPCDLEIDIDLIALYDDYFNLGEPPIMVVGTNPKEDIDGDYILFDKNNVITELSRNNPYSNIYCSGIQVINPNKINRICDKKENFYDVWSQLINEEMLKVSNILPNKWYAYDKISQIIK